jgi:predicted ester cyclase
VYDGINIYRLANGKIVETWQLGDVLGILRQMGVSIGGQVGS